MLHLILVGALSCALADRPNPLRKQYAEPSP